MAMKLNILIVGSGSFGMAMAWCVHRAGHRVTIACKTHEDQVKLSELRIHALFPHKSIPLAWNFLTGLSASLEDFDLAILAIPTQNIINFFKKHKKILSENNIPWLVTCKGMDQNTGFFVTEMINFCGIDPSLVGLIAGPNAARDIVDDVPSWISLWTFNHSNTYLASFALEHETLHVIACDDVLAMQTASSLKNVYAIVMGLAKDAGLNFKAALFQACWKELCFLVSFFGGDSRSLNEYVFGLGDFFLTAGGNISRNVHFGEKLADGILWEALEQQHPLAEGVFTLKGLWKRLNTSQELTKINDSFLLHIPMIHMLIRHMEENLPLNLATLEQHINISLMSNLQKRRQKILLSKTLFKWH
jgi:glycerol-3-phosphate dehydrogenase (NAD(P)+)